MNARHFHHRLPELIPQNSLFRFFWTWLPVTWTSIEVTISLSTLAHHNRPMSRSQRVDPPPLCEWGSAWLVFRGLCVYLFEYMYVWPSEERLHWRVNPHSLSEALNFAFSQPMVSLESFWALLSFSVSRFLRGPFLCASISQRESGRSRCALRALQKTRSRCSLSVWRQSAKTPLREAGGHTAVFCGGGDGVNVGF